MAKRKRQRNISLAAFIEGDREEAFLVALRHIYAQQGSHIKPIFDNNSGGSPDSLVNNILKKCDRDRAFIWFDEDFEPDNDMSADVRAKLANQWCVPEDQLEAFFTCPLKSLQTNFNKKERKPILIVSNPICVESVILIALGQDPAFSNYIHEQRNQQIQGSKDKLQQLIAASKLKEHDFYCQTLTIENLEENRKKSNELDLLIRMIT